MKLALVTIAAFKKSFVSSILTLGMVMPFGLVDVFELLGPHGTAYVFALLASFIRWPLFKLQTREALVGILSIPILAFILTNIHPPFIDEALKLNNPQEYPMIFGTVFGLIPNLVGGWLIDFVTVLRKVKLEENQK